MNVMGYYYLHSENNALIYKREVGGVAADLIDSDFVRMFWPIDVRDRGSAWRLLVEASALGAAQDRVRELADKWGCDDQDAETFASRLGVKLSFNIDTQRFRAEVNEPGGISAIGHNSLSALAGLAIKLGFKAQKMWGPTFAGLVTSYRKQLKSGKVEEK